MTLYTTRRGFIQRSAAAGFLAGLSGLESLGSLPPVAAADVQLDPDAVPLPSEIEPLVRLLEETPRERLLEEVAARIRGGCPIAPCWPRCCLAGVRNVQPRPSVGFKFHAVLVVTPRIWPPWLPPIAALAADLLGAGLLQVGPGPGRARRQLDDAAGGRVGGAGSPSGAPGLGRRHGPLGRSRGRRRRGRPGPLGRRQRGLRAVLTATGPATSVRSATRRSSSPTASGCCK